MKDEGGERCQEEGGKRGEQEEKREDSSSISYSSHFEAVRRGQGARKTRWRKEDEEKRKFWGCLKIYIRRILSNLKITRKFLLNAKIVYL